MIEASKAWTHQYCWFVPVVLAVFAAATSAGRADENAAPLANRLDATELKAQLQSLERELAEEKATLETRQQTQASELTELQASRGDLAHRLLTAQSQRESVAARLKELQAKSESASMASEALVAEANSIPSLLIEATEQLQLLLQEVPGTDESVLRTRDLLATFSEEKEGTSSREAILPAISELFDLMDRFEPERVSVSLSSMHASTMTEELARQVRRVRKSGFTIAPEAGGRLVVVCRTIAFCLHNTTRGGRRPGTLQPERGIRLSLVRRSAAQSAKIDPCRMGGARERQGIYDWIPA